MPFLLFTRLGGLALAATFMGRRFAAAAGGGRLLFNGRSLSDSKSDSDALPEEFQLFRLQAQEEVGLGEIAEVNKNDSENKCTLTFVSSALALLFLRPPSAHDLWPPASVSAGSHSVCTLGCPGPHHRRRGCSSPSCCSGRRRCPQEGGHLNSHRPRRRTNCCCSYDVGRSGTRPGRTLAQPVAGGPAAGPFVVVGGKRAKRSSGRRIRKMSYGQMGAVLSCCYPSWTTRTRSR